MNNYQINNPMNLKFVPTLHWNGQEAEPFKGFCCFTTLQAGLNAGVKNLLHRQILHKLNCVSQIVSDPVWGYAPASDANNDKAYEDVLCKELCVSPLEVINLSNPVTLKATAKAIVKHEQGTDLLTEEMYNIAVSAALGVTMGNFTIPKGDNKTTVGMAMGTDYITHNLVRPMVAAYVAKHPNYGIDIDTVSQVIAVAVMGLFLWFKQTGSEVEAYLTSPKSTAP